MGTIYLVHFDKPFRHARHYLGWASRLDARLAHHANGTGANLLRHAKEAGVTWQLVRIWPDQSRLEERRLKNMGSRARLCPVCNPTVRNPTLP